jgi:transmembrane sensor
VRLPPKVVPKRFRTRTRIAAAVVAVAGVAAVAQVAILPDREEVAPAAPVESTRYATARGQMLEARLPDGSRVWLGPESQLRVEPSGDTSRDVVLEGEAYFDVAPDDQRPFTVRVRNAVVRDLGTRFAVRAYADDSLVTVLVTQGKVNVTSSTAAGLPGTMLAPGMFGRINSRGSISVRSGVDTSRYLGFTRSRIVLVAVPLRDAVRELERWYDIEFRLADSSMGARRITATIAGQTLPELLEQLSIALNVRVSRSAGSAILSDMPVPRRAF